MVSPLSLSSGIAGSRVAEEPRQPGWLPPPQLVERQIRRDAEEPRLRSVVVAHRIEPLPGAKERLLRDIQRGLVSGQHASQVAIERVLILCEEGIESGIRASGWPRQIMRRCVGLLVGGAVYSAILRVVILHPCAQGECTRHQRRQPEWSPLVRFSVQNDAQCAASRRDVASRSLL